jgi:hypothetical protein
MMLGGRRRANVRLLRLVTAYWQSQMVFVAARLGIADALANGPLSIEELALRVRASRPHLARVMRALASLGVFAADKRGRFRLTAVGDGLRKDAPVSLRDFTLMLVDDYNWSAWGALQHAVQTGESAFEHIHGMGAFAWMRSHPEKERQFAASMASISAQENPAVAQAYAFGRLRKLVDVGGAHGHLLATILRAYRRLHGVLFDQPQVVALAADTGHVGTSDVRARCEIAGGDFFDAVPEGGDAYVMKYILHDWNDAQCVRILENCRRAMATEGRVLIVEHLISGGNRRDWGKLLDINMMVVPGGQERTRAEYERLFAGAGLRLQRVIATASTLSILEAVPAR